MSETTLSDEAKSKAAFSMRSRIRNSLAVSPVSPLKIR